MTGDRDQRRVRTDRAAPSGQEHLPLRPLWLCRRCGQRWPCGAAKLALLAEYQDSPLSLFLYLAGCLHDAIDDLHQLHPSDTGGIADVFDRFLGWPARHVRSYRVATRTSPDEEEPS
ncbi:hypothetical protein O7602_22550 [Micromonospora sp. WMMD1128]|uniref:hypothetical protein n=1 Tax=Micromonospora sp. WMMD1128 TaxID=3015150 RepID=UPI00248AD141|nr:hypothetical protein [Micromonospora sp. WMMD1128]WBB72469.1 hypothetical protein O7602_22550 [Micromonospora sp. WMMD1128]